MLKKINRGLMRKDFESSREAGRMYQSPLFGVSVMKNEGVGQVGFVISKKISKRAVDRNRIKRLLCEAMKEDIEKIQSTKPKAQKIIILVRKNILEASLDEIKKCWEMVFEKINEQR